MTQVYASAASLGLFPSAAQRSIYNEPNLTARPVWTIEQTGHQDFFRILEGNWVKIRAEMLALLPADFAPEAEKLRESGGWGQYELFGRGRRHDSNCLRAPFTCSLVGNYPPVATCKRGQVKALLAYF